MSFGSVFIMQFNIMLGIWKGVGGGKPSDLRSLWHQNVFLVNLKLLHSPFVHFHVAPNVHEYYINITVNK